jgi:RNA polymerase sporulation-specific sigma factor
LKNGQDIKIEQIAEILKVSKEDIALAIDANSSAIVTSINEPVYSKDSSKTLNVEDIIPDTKNQEAMINDKLTVNKLIEELQPQEKQIVMMRYYKGSTQTEVAKTLGISQVQVSRIEKRILYSMKQKLQADTA